MKPVDLYIKKGQQLSDQPVDIQLNGRTLTLIFRQATPLKEDRDYTVDHARKTVKITETYITKLIAESAGIRTKEQLTFTFDKGANQVMDVILYDHPKLEKSEFTVLKSRINGDPQIPESLNGTTLKTVKGVVDSTGKPVLEEVWSLMPYLNSDEDFYEKDGDLYLRERVFRYLYI
ncbi:X2-like carbohydrate binding domain-containing protein [Bacillus sp. WMMC1349]|uniref:X2-like carbohydrate binding domain-containing protein n=1 Tax=Bacillus sp. WMMC1349 TaxID=2736254 RepID=UPI0020A6567F|nr:X2-like carbohydrate binding domain-containing protein [Bacillus sp. WMMC1349]